jgi:nitric oxide reductase subunit C
MGKLDERAPVITDQVNAGKKVWHKYDCIGCHTILGNGSYFAPDMTKVAVRKPVSYLKKFIMNPKAVRSDAAMPVLGITDEEADNLMAFLEWISKVDTNGWPPPPILAVSTPGGTVSVGQVLFKRNACDECHQIGGIGGVSGPDLTTIGARQPQVDWHVRHLRDPEALVPDSAMPDYAHLSDDDLNDLAEFLVTLK